MRDEGYRKAGARDLAVLGLPFGGLMLLALLVREPWAMIPAMLVGAPLAVAGLVRQLRRSSRWPCSRCGAPMRRHGVEKNGPVRFFCPPCDVVWDTGLEERPD
jgi:hypothetical protein